MAERSAWLVKSEPATFGFEHLWRAPGRTTPWDGVRNYQARNYMRDEMRVGDPVLFYHSNATPPGVVGLAEVASAAYPDPSQFDPASAYHDPKSAPDAPRWMLVDVRAVARLPRLVPLDELRADPVLASLDLPLLRRGNRLSVMPVPLAAVARVRELAERPAGEP
ncbi:MAG: EVE domain-containing protein [Trueperaceae bacterium]|nr:EVE domain-containing protein [Trueperaceae bacterium]